MSVSVACQCLFPSIFRVWRHLLSGVCFTGPGHGIKTTCPPSRRQSGTSNIYIFRLPLSISHSLSLSLSVCPSVPPEGAVSLGDPAFERLAGLAPPQQRGCSTGLACGWHARLLATVTWSLRLGHTLAYNASFADGAWGKAPGTAPHPSPFYKPQTGCSVLLQ